MKMVPGAGLEPARRLPFEGFSYQLQLSLLRTKNFTRAFVVWTFSSPYRELNFAT